MLINEVCKKCGLTKKAIEYYEEQGLTHPQIMENGYRVFSENDVIQLRKTAVLRGLGISVADIKTVLAENDHLSFQNICDKKERTRLMKPCLHLLSPKCENSTMEKMYF